MSPADVEDLFADIAPVTVKRMFGGLGVYRDGLMFALVADGELFMKVNETTKPAFEAAGASPFVYDGGGRPVTMPYWRLPAEAFDDAEILARFAQLAFEAALQAGPPNRRRSKRPSATIDKE